MIIHKPDIIFITGFMFNKEWSQLVMPNKCMKFHCCIINILWENVKFHKNFSINQGVDSDVSAAGDRDVTKSQAKYVVAKIVYIVTYNM